MRKFFGSTRNRVIVAVAAVFVVLVAVFFGLFAYYQNHALPGSEIGIRDVSGKTSTEVTQILTETAGNQEITVEVAAQTETVSIADTGISIDVPAAVEQVFSANRNPLSFLTGFFGGNKVIPTTVVDEAKFKSFVESLPLPDEPQAVEAEVSFETEASAFVATEGKTGVQIDAEALQKELVSRAEALTSGTVVADILTVEPQISTTAAEAAAQQANDWLDTSITVGSKTYTDSPTREIQASWVKFSPSEAELRVSIDVGSVKKWVDQVAEVTNDEPITGKRNVYSNGEVAAVSVAAVNGYTASNTQAISEQIAKTLENHESVTATFEYAEEEAKWEDRPVASGSENLVYKPAEGEKWIDLNLGNSTVTAYEGSKVVGGPFYMVPGAPDTPTIAGEFSIYLKYETQTMRGLNSDGSKYETPDVPWVSYFSGGYGFHGAPWRSSFGWSGVGGSHGCVNMPVSDAKFIYDWADMGTKVISHY